MQRNAWHAVFCVFIACACACVRANVFLHNPRGSNNRLNEDSASANNPQRLFNSQNYAAGGYCWGPPLSYVEGSSLTIEWSSLLGCGIDNECTEVLQYLCTDSSSADAIRDGTTTLTISPDNYNQKNDDGSYVYGMAENLADYQSCNSRDRNKGLFTANENVQFTATSTRQNPSGARSGFECPEERDYYPYWHPSPWKDIAIFTTDPSTCPFYKSEGQNVKPKNFCSITASLVPNNKAECENAGGTWSSTPAFGLPAPDCMLSTSASDNYQMANPRNYTWKMPTRTTDPCIATNSCSCMLRLRLNVTSSESTGVTGNFIDSRNNLNTAIKVDPLIDLEGLGSVQLMMNPLQFGRVFQDRSYSFSISPRPSNIPATTQIYNLNVKGKRGSFQSVYPAIGYKFTPDYLEVKVGDVIHFQWTGCDTNPPSALGAGLIKTDRSNIVQIADLTSNLPLDVVTNSGITPLFQDVQLRALMANINQTNCLTAQLLLQQQDNTGLDPDQNNQNCMLLNQAGPYFNAPLVTMNTTGSFAYMCTRNNNFSNRFQKGLIVVKP